MAAPLSDSKKLTALLIVSISLFAAIAIFFGGLLGFYGIVALFLLFSIIFTYFVKKLTSFETHTVVTLLRTRKPLWIFDRFAHHSRLLDFLTEAGLVLGFGAIAVDYLHGRKAGGMKRAALFAFTVLFLIALLFGIDLLFNNAFSEGVLTKNFFFILSLVFGLMGFAGFTIAILAMQAVQIVSQYLVGERACPGVAPLIPGIEIPSVPVVIPAHAWISLILILIIHEAMHGIVSRKEKIPVKSTGLLLFGFIPIGGFVEPDEKKLLAAEEKKQLRVYAAGPAANLAAFAGLNIFLVAVFLLIGATIAPWANEIRDKSVAGVEIVGVQEKIEFCGKTYGSSSFGQLREGMKVNEINGKKVQRIDQITSEISSNRFQPITLTVDLNGLAEQILLVPNELGSFGFIVQNIPASDFNPPQEFLLYSQFISLFADFFGWFILLNFLLALMNFLPIPTFDGGRIAPLLLHRYLGAFNLPEEKAKKTIVKFFLYTLVSLFILNALPLFI